MVITSFPRISLDRLLRAQPSAATPEGTQFSAKPYQSAKPSAQEQCILSMEFPTCAQQNPSVTDSPVTEF